MKNEIGLAIAAFLTFIVASMHAQAASFDCNKADTKIEKTICSDNELSELDGILSSIYEQALDRSTDRQQVIKKQKEWLKGIRNTCQETECLTKVYKKRINDIDIERESFLHVQCKSSTGVMQIENILPSDRLPIDTSIKKHSPNNRNNLSKQDLYSIQRTAGKRSCTLGTQTYFFFITYHPSRERGECAAAEFLSLWIETPHGNQLVYTIDGYACMPTQPFLKSLQLDTKSNSINVCTSNNFEEPHDSFDCRNIPLPQ